jgi:hypothetical protein
MKYVLVIIAVWFMISSCQKDDSIGTAIQNLKGYWLLTEITGGFAGTGYEANFDHLQINEEQVYALMAQDAVIQEGTYQLREEEEEWIIDFIPGMMDTISFDNEEKTIIFNEGENILTLRDPCCDLYVYTFRNEG